MAEDEDSPMVEEELPLTVRKEIASELQEQQRNGITREEDSHISEEEEMVEEGALMSSATGATSGGTDPTNAWKLSMLARGKHLLHSLKKLKHDPKRLKMWQK